MLKKYIISDSILITGDFFRGYADGTDIDQSKTIIWEEDFEVPIKYFSFHDKLDVINLEKISKGYAACAGI